MLCLLSQVISDFDMTLTRFKDNEGHVCDSSYGNFSLCESCWLTVSSIHIEVQKCWYTTLCPSKFDTLLSNVITLSNIGRF